MHLMLLILLSNRICNSAERIIFDRNGKILVGNQPSYEISFFTQNLMKPDFDTIDFVIF